MPGKRAVWNAGAGAADRAAKPDIALRPTLGFAFGSAQPTVDRRHPISRPALSRWSTREPAARKRERARGLAVSVP